MTREEAIATLEESKRQNKIMIDNPTTFWASHQMADGVKNAKRRIEALDHALSALRPVSREQVEKVWRGCINCHDEEKLAKHIHCWPSFCPACGRPLTDEAVEMVLERLEALNENRD